MGSRKKSHLGPFRGLKALMDGHKKKYFVASLSWLKNIPTEAEMNKKIIKKYVQDLVI